MSSDKLTHVFNLARRWSVQNENDLVQASKAMDHGLLHRAMDHTIAGVAGIAEPHE
jgi:hypothetical protein